MISNEFSLSGVALEEAQERIKSPKQESDFFTMKAEDFFEWLEKCNAKNPLPKDLKVKPIKYNLEEKCRIIKKLRK